MPARTITVESPTEITVNAIMANVSTTLIMNEAEMPTPKQVFVGELSDDPQRTAEFLASIEAQCNNSDS